MSGYQRDCGTIMREVKDKFSYNIAIRGDDEWVPKE